MSAGHRLAAYGELMQRYGQVLRDSWRHRAALGGPVLGEDEAAFLPAALALQERPVSPSLRLTAGVLMLLVASAVVQLGPGQVLSRRPLVGASFLLGWFAQSLKICIDTVVQAHVDDEWKGRVFVIYDGLFNAAIVLAAVIAAVVLPEDAASLLALTVLGVAYLMLAACFWAATRASHAEFNRGTDLTM